MKVSISEARNPGMLPRRHGKKALLCPEGESSLQEKKRRAIDKKKIKVTDRS